MSLGLLWNEIQNNALLTRLFQTYYEIKWYKWKVIIFVKMLFTPRDSVLLWQWSTNGIVVYIFPRQAVSSQTVWGPRFGILTLGLLRLTMLFCSMAAIWTVMFRFVREIQCLKIVIIFD